jgi:hypothetical protein
MDWDKIIHSLGAITRKTFVLAGSLILVMASCASVYVAALALLWLVRHAQRALGV